MTVLILLNGLQSLPASFYKGQRKIPLPFGIRHILGQAVDQVIPVKLKIGTCAPTEGRRRHRTFHPLLLHDGTKNDRRDRVLVQILRKIIDPKGIILIMQSNGRMHIRL